MKELPDWIGDLKNLQFLLLNNCKEVHTIPTGITRLKNLRCLEIFDGTEVDEMPRGIRGLVQLHKLIDFTVNKDDGTLEELGPLVNLRMLGITKIRRILDKEKAQNAALKDMGALRYLCLECTLPITVEEETRRRVAKVFDELCPPPSLEIVNIIDYIGIEHPNWMWPAPPPDFSLLQNVTWIGLANHIYCSQLPPLGLLPCLKKLWVEGASSVANIGSEFLRCPLPSLPPPPPSATVLFPNLKWMVIIDMPNLEEWQWGTEGHRVDMTALPCLQELYIEGWPKLRSFPQGLWHGPKRMYITNCPALNEVGNVDVLELVQFEDNQTESLPPWLGQVFINPASNSDDDDARMLIMKVKIDLLKRFPCQKQGGDPVLDGGWQTIKHIPRVYASATDDESATFSYMKSFHSSTLVLKLLKEDALACSSDGTDELEARRRHGVFFKQ